MKRFDARCGQSCADGLAPFRLLRFGVHLARTSQYWPMPRAACPVVVGHEALDTRANSSSDES
jgi:hypothetical protein